MASWFRAAEDLFEVVDRRAKLVVGEKPEEQSNSQTPAANGQGSQTKRTRLKAKAQKRLSSNETPKTIDTSLEHNSSEASESDVALDKDRGVSSIGNDGISLSNSNAEVSNEDQLNVEKDRSLSASSLSETILNEEIKHKAVDEKVPAIVSDVEAIVPTSNGKPVNEGLSDGLERVSSSLLSVSGVEVVHKDPPVDSGQSFRMGDAVSPKKIEQEGSQPVSVDTPSKVDTQLKDDDLKFESLSNHTKPQEHKADTSSVKIEDQLDEAQGLLKTSISTGQSKEARLARVCAGLQSRLQEYKSENAQLEELLIAERELSQSCEARIKQLQREISEAKNEATKVESNMAEALAAKNKEIEALLSSMDSLKKQAALSEGNLASLQANMESIMRSRELTETRMMQAVREELASAERRAEEEHAAHNATKMKIYLTKQAAMEREVELEHRAIEASTALARIQRTADERTSKATELEQKVALLEVECASLNQELQDMEARARRGPKKAPEEANQMIQMQAWQKEVERARQGQRDAESKLSSLEAEVQKMRVEMAAMKRDAEHYSRQEHMELEKRYRELTDLLYYKQTQLEAMASDKAAAEFQLEKEMKRLQEAQVEAERSRSSRRASSYWEEDNDMKELEPLPLHHRHMVGARMQLQKAAKFLDSGAVRATRFLWRYPTARVLLLFYLVFVHLFLMYLLHRLQEQDDTFASREVAESMGLANHTLP
ncbi:Golgin candidate like [Actinidia chinensis var. chinensis]|uniref:Golgin candidate like n=1 Tax=Actinidia chinensis var. chinensis TaxID=1590841 RepID=A0A2R6Q4W4_ACTCC|nr:Golgin candidate like [Actinidia chinensis var. chinensis]